MSDGVVVEKPQTESSVPEDQQAAQPQAGTDSVVTIVSLLSLLVLMARLVVHAAKPLGNADTWFHLRIGHELWGPWTLTHPGSVSRFATSDWVPTQWATEMLMARVEDWFGLPGVAWLYGAFYLTFVVLLYVVCRARADMLTATMATGAAVIGSGAVLSARPQVLSLVLFTLTAALWNRAARTGHPPWVLVPLTWLWASVHGLWSAGVLLGLVCCVGIWLDSRGTDRRVARLFAVPLLSLVAAALTPVGPGLLVSQFTVSQRTSLIGEWAATSFRSPDAFAVAVMAGVLLLVWTRHGRIAWTPLLTLVLACGWAVLVTRMVAFSAVLLAPLLAEALSGLKAPRRPSRGQIRAERMTVGIGVVVLLATLAAVVPHTAAKPVGVPDRLSRRLAALPARSPVLVEDTVGSWIEWRFPHLQPTLDGMFDAYPVGYLKRFASAHGVEKGWEGYVADTGATVAVTVQGSALTNGLRTELGWRVVQHDGEWVYLVAPGR